MDRATTRNREGNATPTTSLSNEPDRNVFEDIHGDEDVLQFIGSTSQKSTTAKSIHAKSRATQCFGDMADSTFQRISSDRGGRVEQDEDEVLSVNSTSIRHGPGQRLGRSDPVLDGENQCSELLK
ncbi:hypothetical protein EIK77_006306 [Talaromyces pinophilus]|nr:hypothetical protein EIK77_006306 [Talaromyces pinophilus]